MPSTPRRRVDARTIRALKSASRWLIRRGKSRTRQEAKAVYTNAASLIASMTR